MIREAVGVLANVLEGDPGGVLNDVLEGALDDVLDGILALLPST